MIRNEKLAIKDETMNRFSLRTIWIARNNGIKRISFEVIK